MQKLKTIPYKKCCNSVIVAQIWAKLSALVREYSRNICCEFYYNNWDGSTHTAVWTLNFNVSSEHAVAHWIFTNNKSNFAQLFINNSVIHVRYLRLILYLNRVFTMSLPACCGNTWLKSVVAKWYNCHINERMKQIILYWRQNGFLVRHDVGQLRHVTSIVFQCSIPHMIIYWHIHMGHLLLFVHQNRRLVTRLFRKMYF